MALGAQAGDVLKLVLRNGMSLAFIGAAIGLAGAYAVTRVMSSLLFEVVPTDLATFATVSVGLIVVALLACFRNYSLVFFVRSNPEPNDFVVADDSLGLRPRHGCPESAREPEHRRHAGQCRDLRSLHERRRDEVRARHAGG